MEHRFPTHRRGFSLLEVLIAVLVLSIGLLAIAALQGSLTRSSADAKVRARVAAMLSARMDALRSAGYAALPASGTATATSTGTDTCDNTPADWLDCTREQAALGSLSVSQAVDTWYGAASFATPAPSPANPKVAQFRRVTLGATWEDATGATQQLSITSDISALGLANNVVIPPEDSSAGRGGPIVRTTDPATAGVIPIALSTDSTSATSNPIPELVGQANNQKIVGTRFNVLNYTPPAGGAVVIQKRFETEVVKCSCRYGAGGNNLPEIYRTAQWPAVWTGERYEVFKSDSDPAGQALSAGPKPGVEQNALCQECCRDHHDSTATNVARFDPERSDGSVSKYDQTNAGLVLKNNTNGDYVDACRLVRIDGFWRTASDLYARQFGLLETQAVGGVAAKSGLPTTAAVDAYTTFAKDFLDAYDGTSATPPEDAQARFDATAGINEPALVTIPRASATDYRYLHARALYVDYLEAKARTFLHDVLADTGPQGRCPQGSVVADCVLPNLPFTTINLTEIATWIASDANVLTVNSSNLLATDPSQPSGGRTIGKAVGMANNQASMRRSNSGIAVNTVLTNVAGVDPGDNAVLGDAQAFEVGTSAGPAFSVRVTGGGGSPFVYFTLGTDADVECLKPAGSDHQCVTATGTTLPQPGAIRLANYWVETTVTQSLTANCNGQTATANVAVPIFRNYAVTAAAIGGLLGTIASPVNDNRNTESTTVSFSAISANDRIDVTLAEEAGSPTYATIASCTTNGGHNQINNIVWNKPWTLP